MADSYGKVSNISGYDELRKVARSGERIVDTQALLKKIKESRKPKLGPKERPEMIDRDRDKITDTIDADSRPQVIQKLNQIYKKGKGADQSSETPIVDELTTVLKTWETKSYPNDKARWQEYTTDIANLLTKYQG